jgi:thiamine biosynthesis lipoprotein
MAAERRFAAMGTDAHVIVVGADADHLADAATERIEELEARWSRFRPTSEVTRINAGAGAWVPVSTDTTMLVARAKEAWRLSAGFVDCTLLPQLEAAGYDAPFADLPASRANADVPPVPPVSLLGPMAIDVSADAVRLPVGLGFDPGGIGKGLAADLVSDELVRAGAGGVCVNLGGDLRVRGTGPDGRAWTVSIDHPDQPAPLALVGLADGAVATSTTLRRRWTIGGVERHHLIDPRTGTSSTTDLVLVAVVARSAWLAEVLAKGVLLRGSPRPFDLVDGTGAHALVVDRHGRITASAGLPAYLGGQPLPERIRPRDVGMAS